MPLSPVEVEAVFLSLRISAAAVVCSLPLALSAALLLALGTRAPVGAWLLHTFDIRLVFNWTGAAVAAGIVTFPFQVRAMWLALEGVDRGLEAAARSLGASRPDVFCSVTFPLMLPGILAGAITAFAA